MNGAVMPSRGRRRCAARTATGKPCSMAPLADSDRCFNHAPEAAPERAKARKRGGRRTAAPILFPLPEAAVQLRDVASIQTVLEEVMHETRAQRNSSHRTRAIGSLLLIALKAIETGGIDERLTALEQQILQRNLRRA